MFPEDSISILCCSRLFHMHIITILLIFPPTIYRGRVMNCGGSQRENGGGAAKQGRKKNQKEEPIQSDNRSENGREKHGQWREIASKQKGREYKKKKKKKKKGVQKKNDERNQRKPQHVKEAGDRGGSEEDASAEVIVLDFPKCFCEDIHQLLRTLYPGDLQVAMPKVFIHKMKFAVDVSCTFHAWTIGCNFYCRLIVREEHWAW